MHQPRVPSATELKKSRFPCEKTVLSRLVALELPADHATDHR
jgi:hypothetical protein